MNFSQTPLPIKAKRTPTINQKINETHSVSVQVAKRDNALEISV